MTGKSQRSYRPNYPVAPVLTYNNEPAPVTGDEERGEAAYD